VLAAAADTGGLYSGARASERAALLTHKMLFSAAVVAAAGRATPKSGAMSRNERPRARSWRPAGRPTTIAVRSGRRLTTSSTDRALERFSHY